MKIAIGADHAGFPMKQEVIEALRELGCGVTDHGTHNEEPVDFPDIAAKVTADVRAGAADRGVMVCGTGVGAAIAANKTPGIRAAVCHDTHCAHQCVEHDDVNVLCIGAKIIGPWLARDILKAFIEARFSTAEHFRRRVTKLAELEKQSAREVLAGQA